MQRNKKITTCLTAFIAMLATFFWLSDVNTAVSAKTQKFSPVQTAAANVAPGIYRLRNKCSNKVLDVSGISLEQGARLQQWTQSDGLNQQFKLEATDSGYFKLTAQHSGLVVDAQHSQTADGTIIWQWANNGTNAQQWRAMDVGGGYYKLESRLQVNKVLDVNRASTADGAKVQLWTANGTCAQSWRLEAVGGTTPPTNSGSWVSLNPGAGGQLQAVVLDPNQTDRAFLLSDVEGLYRTNNGGASWSYAGRGVAGTDSLSLAVRPGNSNIAYLGTSIGLHTSNDGGLSWRLSPQVNRSVGDLTDDPNDPGYGSGKMSIGSIAVNRNNVNQVVAGLGSRRWSYVNRAAIYRSTDGGTSFSKVIFGNGVGNESVLQLVADPTSNALYAAAGDGGLWKSASFGSDGTWGKISKPQDANERVEGVGVTPDGKTLYVLYKDPSDAGNVIVYATRTAQIQWKKIPFGGASSETSNHFRTVAIDPRSGENNHRFVIANDTDRRGLYEVKVTWSGNSPSAAWRNIFNFGQRQGAYNPDDNAKFDLGWEGGIFGTRPRPLSYQYSPTSWSKYEIWSTGDQTLFHTDRTQSDFWNKWQFAYTSGPVNSFPETDVNVGWTPTNTYGIVGTILTIPSLGPIQTYKNVGIASTVDFDASLYGNFVMSSKGDHGMVLSYDDGKSWENVSAPRRARSNSNLIVNPVPGQVYALAHFGYPFDFGASPPHGELWARTVDPNNLKPERWYFLAGGPNDAYGSSGSPSGGDQTLGLPNDTYTNILSDPSNKKRIYVTTQNQGIYRVEDITFLFCVRLGVAACGTNLPRFDKLSNVKTNEYENSAVIDPNNSQVMYVADGNKLKRLNLATTPAQVSEVLSSNTLMTFGAWNWNGTTYIVAVSNNEAYISKNGGANWIKSFTLGDLKAKGAPKFDFSLTENKLQLFSVHGYDNKVYAVAQVQNPENLGYGVFEVAVNSNGQMTTIRNITENHYFPKSLRTEVVTDPVSGRRYLLMSSWGAGLWRRPI